MCTTWAPAGPPTQQSSMWAQAGAPCCRQHAAEQRRHDGLSACRPRAALAEHCINVKMPARLLSPIPAHPSWARTPSSPHSIVSAGDRRYSDTGTPIERCFCHSKKTRRRPVGRKAPWSSPGSAAPAFSGRCRGARRRHPNTRPALPAPAGSATPGSGGWPPRPPDTRLAAAGPAEVASRPGAGRRPGMQAEP